MCIPTYSPNTSVVTSTAATTACSHPPCSPSLDAQVSAGQASASSASTRRSRSTGSNGRKRPRDWTWARNPTFLCLRSELSRLPASTREKAVKKAFAEFDRQEEGSVAVEEMEEIFSTLASLPGSGNGGAVVVSQAELRDLCASLYAQSMGQSGPSGGRRCIAYDEVVKALILGEKDFDARFPAPLVRRPGAETRLLYERVLQERRNVVVGHKTPQDKGEGKGGAKAEGEEGKFLAACRLIDRKKTGLIRCGRRVLFICNYDIIEAFGRRAAGKRAGEYPMACKGRGRESDFFVVCMNCGVQCDGCAQGGHTAEPQAQAAPHPQGTHRQVRRLETCI